MASTVGSAGLAVAVIGGSLLPAAAAHRATVEAPRFSKTLTDVVAPGTLSTVHWTIPPKQAFTLNKLSIHGTGGSSGVARIQLVRAGKQPGNLMSVALGQIKTTFGASFATPLIIAQGQLLALSVACNPNQPGCRVSLTFSGQLGPAPSGRTGKFYSDLENVVAPGTISTVHWTVPVGHSLTLTDLLLSSNDAPFSGVTPNGQVIVQRLTRAGKVQTVLKTTIANLVKKPVDDRLGTPLSFAATDSIAFSVSCGANQPACDAVALFSGRLS